MYSDHLTLLLKIFWTSFCLDLWKALTPHLPSLWAHQPFLTLAHYFPASLAAFPWLILPAEFSNQPVASPCDGSLSALGTYNVSSFRSAHRSHLQKVLPWPLGWRTPLASCFLLHHPPSNRQRIIPRRNGHVGLFPFSLSMSLCTAQFSWIPCSLPLSLHPSRPSLQNKSCGGMLFWARI